MTIYMLSMREDGSDDAVYQYFTNERDAKKAERDGKEHHATYGIHKINVTISGKGIMKLLNQHFHENHM